MQNHPIKNANGSWARSNIQKAKRFKDYLESTFQPHPREEPTEWEIFVQEEINFTTTSQKKVTRGKREYWSQESHWNSWPTFKESHNKTYATY